MRYSVHELRFKNTIDGERAFASVVQSGCTLEEAAEIAADFDDSNRLVFIWPQRPSTVPGDNLESDAPELPLGGGGNLGTGLADPNPGG